MRAIKNKLQVNSVAEFVTLFNSSNRSELRDQVTQCLMSRIRTDEFVSRLEQITTGRCDHQEEDKKVKLDLTIRETSSQVEAFRSLPLAYQIMAYQKTRFDTNLLEANELRGLLGLDV